MAAKRSPLTRHIEEARLFRQRATLCMAIILLTIGLLLFRLIYLQLIEHQFYATLSRQNLLGIIPLEPSRGLIYDRNGVVLARNTPSYSLALIPEKIKDIPGTIDRLKNVIDITDKDINQFMRHRNQYHQFDPIPLKMKLTEEQLAKFYVNQQFFPGVIVQARSTRYYPLGDMTSEVVGYVGRINQNELKQIDTKNYDASDDIGKNGIEKFYEKLLRGRVGTEEAEINATGHVVRSIRRIPPVAGKNLYLTIDSRLQIAAHEALGEENGAVVIIKPTTGEVLALVSHPTFDANLFANGISQEDYQALLNSPNHPLFNRAIHGQYPAASTVKPFIAAIGLDLDYIDTKMHISDPGWFQLPNIEHVYHDWKKGGHGIVNVTRAIMVSCDTFFYGLAARMGIRELSGILSSFGYGSLTGIDFPDEEQGLVPTPEWKRKAHGKPWYPGDTIITGIGQGFFLATPIQIAVAASMMANRGLHVVPHLLMRSVSENGKVKSAKSQFKEPLVLHDNQSWSTVIEAMRQVIDNPEGTAHHFGPHPTFTVAGKTGTSQVYGHSANEDENRTNVPKNLREHHLFIAFAPIDNPEIAIAVVVEHSANADGIAGKLFNLYFEKEHAIESSEKETSPQAP